MCRVSARVADCHFFSATPAPLGKSCVSTGGPRRSVSCSYNALTDPHLYDYYVRKFIAMDPLMAARTPRVLAVLLLLTGAELLLRWPPSVVHVK